MDVSKVVSLSNWWLPLIPICNPKYQKKPPGLSHWYLCCKVMEKLHELGPREQIIVFSKFTFRPTNFSNARSISSTSHMPSLVALRNNIVSSATMPTFFSVLWHSIPFITEEPCIILARASMQKMNKRGLRLQPWASPLDTFMGFEE